MIEPLARLGYISKAFIYAIVGGLAILAALKRGGTVTDTNGALRVILTQPFGNTILFVLATGLCGYALWRVLDAIFDPHRHGADAGGLVTRIGSVVRALVYGGLGVEAFRLARGLRGAGRGEIRLWIARIMDLPLGELAVGIAGGIIVVYGISEIVAAVRQRIGSLIDLSPIPPRMRAPLLKISRIGVAARAAILVVLGYFLVRAALTRDPGEVHDTRQSILELAGAIDSSWLLAAIGLGLIAYSIDQALHARCRRIRSPVG